MMWNRVDYKPYLVDFELMSTGPAVADLCYFISWCGSAIRRKYLDAFLARYHEKLLASGKVDPARTTLEKIKADFVRMFVPRVSFIACGTACWLPDYAKILGDSIETLIEDYDVTPENVLAPHWFGL